MLYLYVLVVVVCVVFLVFLAILMEEHTFASWEGLFWYDWGLDESVFRFLDLIPSSIFPSKNSEETIPSVPWPCLNPQKLVVTIQQSREPNTPTVVVISTSASLQWVTIPQNFPNISPTFPRQMRTSSCTPCACGSQRRRKRSEMVSPGTKWEVIYRLFFMGNDRKTSMPHGKR